MKKYIVMSLSSLLIFVFIINFVSYGNGFHGNTKNDEKVLTKELSQINIASPFSIAYSDAYATMKDPSAVYCGSLGYDYQIAEDEEGGQDGVCVFPDASACSSWDFYIGKCGKRFSFCALNGMDIATAADGRNSFSLEYAVCVDENENIIGTVDDLYNMADKVGATPPGEDDFLRPEGPLPVEDSGINVLPSSFDWRNHQSADWMTPIKSQGQCGSCWSFSAVGVAEAVMNIAANDPSLDLNLSEQYMVTDCALTEGACDGGNKGSALSFIANSGIPDESCLPYLDGNYTTGCSYSSVLGSCNSSICNYSTGDECSDYRCTDRCADWASRLHYIDSRTYLGYYASQDAIKQALIDHGPIAVSMNMSGSFGAAPNYIYTCPSNIATGHAVIVVGFNDTGGYWIVRNSWGTSWGYENGYYNVAYDNCAVQKYPYYADGISANNAPNTPSNPSPADNATNVSINADLSWTGGDPDSGDTVTYDVYFEANDSSPDILLCNDASTAFCDPGTLAYSTHYYWYVIAADNHGATQTGPTWDFTTGSGSGTDILLVDDDDNVPDVRAYYTSALDALGKTYVIWDTINSDNEPDATFLAQYDTVIWFTGAEFGGAAGPGTSGETALGTWLDTGKCLLVSSQDYFFDRGLTSFMGTYLGVSSATSDVTQATVSGTGSVFGGLGPYSLSYSFSNYSDLISPDGTADVAFIGNQGDAAVVKDSGVYRTTFWGFSFEAIPTPTDRQNAMDAFLNWCSPEPEVVINEVDPGTPDAIEFYNAGSQAVDMTGWQLLHNGTSAYTFTNYTLQPDSYVVVYEYGDPANNTSTVLYTDENINLISGSGAVGLIDDNGNGADFVRWSSSSITPPSGTNWTGNNPSEPAAGQTLGRDVSIADTDDGSDWCSQAPSLGSQNAGCGPICYQLTRDFTGTGSKPTASPPNSTGCSVDYFVAGETVTMTPHPATGHHLDYWTGTDSSSSDHLTMPASSHTVTAYYVQDAPTCYALTPSYTGTGSAPTASPTNSSGCSTGQYVAGESITMTANPASGYHLDYWTGSDSSSSDHLTMPASSHTVTAYYIQDAPTNFIVINEVDPNTPDAIEFYNTDGQAVDMTGWQFMNYDKNGALDTTYTFPAFTLQPGAYVVLYESSGTDTATELYTGGNILWINSAGAAELLDASGASVDFVRWGDSTVAPTYITAANWTGPNPAGPASGYTLGRDSNSTDTDSGSDWYSQFPSLGSQNATEYKVFLPLVTR